MTKFTDLNLNAKVLKAIDEAGYNRPHLFRRAPFPPLLKVVTFWASPRPAPARQPASRCQCYHFSPVARARMPRSLVLCPTRELALAENFDYSKHLKLTKALLIGGVSFKEQDKLIDKGVDVLIATPGRLLDLSSVAS